MYHEFVADFKFCALLLKIDQETTAQVKALGCPYCGGRLDRADYPRKPRGGSIAAEGEKFDRRFSLCCSRDGCRKRVTPPSVRFMGRRVYLGVTVLLGSMAAIANSAAGAIRAATGVAARTVRRWLAWWQTAFVKSPFYTGASARFSPPLKEAELPSSLLARFRGSTYGGRVLAVLRWLAPSQR